MSGPAELDRMLLRAVDGAVEEATAAAGTRLVCGIGCTGCCMGPFEISAVDAWRLRRGLEQLAAADPAAALAVAARAREQWHRWRGSFPGDARTGTFAGDDEAGRLEFFAAAGDEPCAALDPDAGSCRLYVHRPLACRSYGLPLLDGGEVVPPCALNFRGADAEEVAAAAVHAAGIAEEGRLAAALAAAGEPSGDTIVAAALAASFDSDV